MKGLSLYRITWAATCQAYVAAPTMEEAVTAWRARYEHPADVEPSHVERVGNCVDAKGRIFE